MEKLRLGQAAVHRGRISVLCIGGTGQNGATLLSRMLGQIPGFVAVGELGRLWDWGLIGNRPCGCGAPFSDCPFWSRVGDAAFDGWDAIDGPHREGAVRPSGSSVGSTLCRARRSGSSNGYRLDRGSCFLRRYCPGFGQSTVRTWVGTPR